MGITTSRKTAAAALAAAVLIGGGIAAVAPAAAEDSAQFAATNWKKVWKNNLQQYADKRYYTKKKSDKKYATKTDLGNYYTKTQTDATYATKALTYSRVESDARYYTKTQSDTNYYTKAQGDAKYAPATLIRGTTMQAALAAGAGERVGDHISWGVTASAAPTAHYIALGAPVPNGCSGTAAAPNATAGNLCVWEVYSSNNTGNAIAQPSGAPGTTPIGAVLFATSAGPGEIVITTSWAVRPTALAAGSTVAGPSETGPSAFGK